MVIGPQLSFHMSTLSHIACPKCYQFFRPQRKSLKSILGIAKSKETIVFLEAQNLSICDGPIMDKTHGKEKGYETRIDP
jgi:hypothetical protein